MKFKQDGAKPIYVQISEWIETEILSGAIPEDHKVFSQYQLAEMFNINPATAAKGLNLLADENILYKKRGLGMFVAPNAPQFILEKRKSQTMKNLVYELVLEAERLGVSETELINLIMEEKERQRGNQK
ncbi:GntR family transcriptional regulator [Bacillus sp. HNG]|uniref:GntR family transcriptional regulator n=1 Tax=Bacillus sp. HNG TaxID=2293325 RepID=UPI000E2EF8B0|nr:GntR family transcriptional regulator [Bacillus sp. HNG]RFB09637.1 GntR family transcriptional regulator [Bacillus sp. HNG]